MNIEAIILELNCEALGCKDIKSCPYFSDKKKCPKQIECLELCNLMCSDIEEEE